MNSGGASSSSAACTNEICVQFRVQHRNMTLKRIELEKELNLLRRAQSNEFNQAVVQRTSTPMKDSVTGDMGLLMKNGEVMTPEKLQKRMEISTKCMESLQASEKHNRQLAEENRRLKDANERMHVEMSRLEKALNGFEKTRRYDTFTEEKHRETLALNAQMADELEALERRMHAMEEEHLLLSRQCRRAAAIADRLEIGGEDEEETTTIATHITADGRVPSKCPCNPEGCRDVYEASVLDASKPADAFADHVLKNHQVTKQKNHAHTQTASESVAVRALQAAGKGRLEARPRAHLRQVEARFCLIDPDPQEAAAPDGRGRFLKMRTYIGRPSLLLKPWRSCTRFDTSTNA